MSTFLYGAIAFTLACHAAAIALALVRMVRGPAAQDRVLAMDLIYGVGMLTLLVLGLRYRSEMYFDAALLISLFGFVGSTAMAKFLLRGEVIE